MSKEIKVTEFLGDGIATELCSSVHAVVSELPIKIVFEPIDLSLDHRQEYGPAIYDEALDPEHTRAVVMVALEAGLLAVLDENGIHGFVAGIKGPLLATPEVLQGTELAWWVDPEYRKGRKGIDLMLFIENLARKQGVKYWNMVSMESSSPETANRIYTRMGYSRSETVYTKVI